jgi:hypothetical protein
VRGSSGMREAWLRSTAVLLREGTYQADSSRPSAVSITTSSCGMPSDDSWISQRGACVTFKVTPAASAA